MTDTNHIELKRELTADLDAPEKVDTEVWKKWWFDEKNVSFSIISYYIDRSTNGEISKE